MWYLLRNRALRGLKFRRQHTVPPFVLDFYCAAARLAVEVAAGDEHEGFAAGTAWADIPADWCCPDCGVREKVDFVPCEPERSVA